MAIFAWHMSGDRPLHVFAALGIQLYNKDIEKLNQTFSILWAVPPIHDLLYLSFPRTICFLTCSAVNFFCCDLQEEIFKPIIFMTDFHTSAMCQ